MARPLWDKQLWLEAKSIIRSLEDDYSLDNQEIQEKILEILREHDK